MPWLYGYLIASTISNQLTGVLDIYDFYQISAVANISKAGAHKHNLQDILDSFDDVI